MLSDPWSQTPRPRKGRRPPSRPRSSAPHPPGQGPGRRPRPGAIALLLVSVLLLGRPAEARAQAGPALLGAAGGFAAGAYTTLAIYVTKARFGRYLFSVDELISIQPEILPVVVGPVAGIWLGAESSTALARAAGWGSLGFLAGAGAGALTGTLVSDSEEAPWAGAIIGSGVGLLAGAILGAVDGLEDGDEGGTPVALSVSIPVGGVR